MNQLARLRREYEARGLDIADVDADPIVEFDRWYSAVRQAGEVEPSAMVLATVDPDGWPSSRTVLLKSYDERGFVFYTNYTSAKARDLDAIGRAALTFTWSAVRRQVRVVGTAERTSAEESDAYFASRPRGSQISAWASDQSAIVASRAELDAAYAAIEQRFAGREIPRPEHWGGYRVRPLVVELWQGRENRLHDRLRYTRDGAAWRIERMAP
ncbi:MAG TPA: pyridoxamine 5'-phosphate oxidase [Longimicrobiales bacterium]